MTEPEKKPASTFTRVALTALAGLFILVVIVRLVPGGGPRGDARSALASEWKSGEVLGLTVSSPGRLRNITVPVPENIRTSIERMESAGRNVGKTELRVTRIEYLPNVPLSLEGSARGAVDEMRVNPAVLGLKHTHARTQVSGVPAIHTTNEFRIADQPAHGEILTVVRGQTLWQLQVVGPSEGTPELARRMMESVRLAP
jgi:hypothetical protein